MCISLATHLRFYCVDPQLAEATSHKVFDSVVGMSAARNAFCWFGVLCVAWAAPHKDGSGSEAEDEGLEGDEPSAKKLKDGEGKLAKIWFDREVKISEAFAAQKDWQQTMEESLKTLHTDGLTMFKERFLSY